MRPGPELALYGTQASRRTYARLGELASGLLAAGHSVVVDAALLRQSEREALRELAQRQGVPFLLLECAAAPEHMEQRLLARTAAGTDASDAGIEVMRRQRSFAEPVPSSWAAQHRVLLNDGSLADLRSALAGLLADWGR